MILLALISCSITSNAGARENAEETLLGKGFTLEPVLKGLPLSWAIALSPENKMFITHRSGNISRIDKVQAPDGSIEYKAHTLAFKPEDLLTGGQGGLLDIIFHPDYEQNAYVYASYSASKDDGNILKVVRFKINVNEISQIDTIFELATVKSTPVHYGGRLAFDANNALLLSSGDGFDYREKAQVLDNHLGKILRMTDSGQAHPDNPFYAQGGNAAYVLSLGHRNPQGLLVTNEGVIIAHEHGPAGGDEVNIIAPGLNYGWPVITNGKDYSGASISPFTSYANMQQPNVDWTPSIAPSGMTLYTADKLSTLKHKVLITSLKFEQIYALEYTSGDFAKEFVLLSNKVNRLRDIEADNNGTVWVLGDGDPATLYQLKAN